jgi:hypothetical protein
MSTFKDKPLKKCHTDSRQMIDDIHQGLIADMDDSEIASYYLDNGLLLDQYYREVDTPIEESSVTGILSFLKGGGDTPVTETTGLGRTRLLNEYIANVDDTVLHGKWMDYEYTICPMTKCGNAMVLSKVESILQCPLCGYTERVIIDCEKGSYNDPPKESNYFAYKRINHFNEWLAQFQAKDISDIPERVYHDVHRELKKNIYLEWSSLTYKQVRAILKSLQYNKYYDNIPHLVNVLSGKSPPKLDRKVEETLRSLFKDIQIPFMNHCPPTRKNFLSYAYVLHKLCELLGYDELLIYFPLLKSREKLQQQDMIWENMCGELEWEFIPSI